MTELTDLSETDADNTIITSANIAEGCAPSVINDAIRKTLGLVRRAFRSNIFRVRDSTDQTKLLAFDVSGVTTGTTRTLTVPNVSGTIAVTSQVPAGASSIIPSSETNLDNYTATGFFLTPATGLTNLPSGWAQGRYHVIVAGGSSYRTQVLSSTATGETATRIYSGSWDGWEVVYTRGNILGAVSQSSGVPTGAVIERGSNANGDYVKFADGTMICTNGSFAIGDRNSAIGSLFVTSSQSWTYPAAFAAQPVFSGFPYSGATSVWGWISLGTAGSSGGATAVFRVAGATSVTGTGSVALQAVGRWF